ncbi:MULTISPECIES: arabinosyltransferase domain-containing protein [unclassified Rhodococcus (in: high G+C Gram-positive bacteria)]|uniref:arabinosyltransferase domain-containing protein n=1 Tax=unclassified Rhodococcus (in: high G+C Gram-positive bacteria) TaxID=192944 RepID=UPI000AB35225
MPKTLADSTIEPPAASVPGRSAFARITIVAVVTGLLGALLAVLAPFLPVEQDAASLTWPQDGSFTSVEAPLVSYNPLALSAAVPCRVLADAPADTVVLSTVAPQAPDARRVGLVIGTDDAGAVSVVLRDQLLLSVPAETVRSCDELTVSSTPEGTTATAGELTGTVPGDQRPQTVGIFSGLTGAAPADLSVRVDVDSRFSSSPSTLKLLAIVLGGLLAVVSLVALHRLDDADGRRARRFFPRHWLRLTGIDVVVLGTLLLWHFIGANTSDDGYLLNMARVSEHSGYMANYYRWFGVPEAPFGMPYYDALAALAKVSTASPWMRLPALIAAILCWLIISREVIPRLGRAVRTRPVAVWTAGLVFLAFWLPYDNGLRPEPVIALGALLTWCSIERAISTGRLLPAAVAVVIAAFSLAAGPTGLIAIAALLAGSRPVLQIIVRRRKAVGLPALLAPILAAGTVVLFAVFADQTVASVLEATRVRSAVGPNVKWFDERYRWDALLNISPDGSLARRFAVFAMLLCLVTCLVVMLRRGGRIPGTSLGPSRRILGIVAGALALMMFTPTKWTHHFGVYAGLAGSLAALAAVAVISATERSPRNRTLFTAAVLFLTSLAFTGSNGWWYVSSYGVPWFDKPPSIAGKGFATLLLGLTVLTLAYAAWQHFRAPFVAAETRRTRKFSGSSLTVVAGLVVLFEVLSLLKGAVAQYPAYSVARSNVNSVLGESCGLARDVLVETDPNASMLQPLPNQGDDPLAGTDSVGFTPDGVARDLSADREDSATTGGANSVDPSDTSQSATTSSAGTGGGTTAGAGVNGSRIALPFGLDPATTPVLGSFGSGDAAPARLTSGWYSLPEADQRDFLAVTAAGRIRSVDADGIVTPGQTLDVEYATVAADGTEQVLGRVSPIDIGPQPSWRNLRVPLDGVPAEANAVRLVASDDDLAGDQWLAVTPPRAPRTTVLNDVVGSTAPVLLDWSVGLAFPCQRPFDHRYGVAELPEWRILPDRNGAESTNAWQDDVGGGPLGWTGLVLGAETLPTYLSGDLRRDWGSLERYTPLDPGAVEVQPDVTTSSRSGIWSPGHIKYQ